MKLSNKIIISFLSIIIISILITSYISSHRINSEFELYLIDEHENKLNSIASNINTIYTENDYILYSDQINSYANNENVSIRIKDLENNILYQSNSTPKHKGMMMRHGNHMMGKSMEEGDYVEKSFPLLKNKIKLGEIIIGFYDNSYLTQSALIFNDTLDTSFFISGVFSLILSLILAIFLSRNLTRPLVKITSSTKKLQEGSFELDLSSEIKNTTLEIRELAKSINYLSKSLKKEDEIRSQYALDISHELRTPITTIKGYLEAIIDGIWEANNDNLDIILEEINRISGLVDDLKNSFLLTSFESELPIENIDLSKELGSIVDIYIPIIRKLNCQLEINIEENVFFNINSYHFKQIIMNLISNAQKYIPENTGLIKIGLVRIENHIIITIEDNGIGIPEDNLPFIFNRLYRVDSSRNKLTGGTGIGLYIVKQLINKYEGTISVTSQINKGSKFTIKF